MASDPAVKAGFHTGLVPSVDWLLYSALRKDALLTSQIEGTQATLTDLFDDEDGLTVLRRWREAGRVVPLLVLTARDRWHEKVEGIDAGADDFETAATQAERAFGA